MGWAWIVALGALAAAAGAALWGHRLQRRLQAERARAEAERAQWHHVVDALDIGLVVYDAADRLQVWNADFARLYPALAPQLAPGMSFESLLRASVAAGLVPEAAGRGEAWIAQRLKQHRSPREPMLRAFPDGRWRRITERFLADGGMLSYSIDVTELVRQGEALKAAREAADTAHTRLQDAIDALPVGFEFYDAEDRLVLSNRWMKAMYPGVAGMLGLGATFEDLVRANAAAGGLPELPCSVDEWIERRQAERRAADGRPRLHLASGRWLRLHERRMRDGGLVGVREDVTAEMAQREAADLASQRLHAAIEALPDGFAYYDAHDRLVVCNERYRAILRESAPAILPGATYEEILRYGLAHGQYPQAAGREAAWIAERLQAHREPGPPTLHELPGNRWLRTDERRTRDGGVAGVRTDVTALVRREQALERLNRELDAANAQLAQLSETDALTGVANRRGLQRRLEEEWARARRARTPLALLLVDIDHFKEFNDAHGHSAGDECLRRVAQLLAGCARRPGELVARLGGEEFVLLLPQTGAQEAAIVARRCQAVLADACIAHGRSPVAPHVTLSIGVADARDIDDADASEHLLERADAAMYRAKRAGRARIEAAA